MQFPFGKYLSEEIDFVIMLDREYCEWTLGLSNIQKSHPDFCLALKELLDATPKFESALSYMSFGKYEGMEMEMFIHDKDYCKWLLKKESFKTEYPNKYNYLERLYELVYDNQIDSKFIYFYVLFFKGEDFFKIGKTAGFVVKRIYNYAGIMTLYPNLNIEFEKCYVYKTNYLDIEKQVLKKFSKHRIDKKSERIDLSVHEEIEPFIKELAEKNSNCYFLRKDMVEFLPFIDSEDFREVFNVKINQFPDFEKLYEECLKENGVYHAYNPHFVGSVN